MSDQSAIAQVKEANKKALLKKPNVVGAGTGYKVSKGQRTDELCLVVLVRRKLPVAGLSPDALVPQELNGVRTDVIEVGDLRPHQNRTDRWRPAPGGVSIGHYQITAGTLGCVVRDRATGARLILSNNHVLANSNNASPGDAILQPGVADGGQDANDRIAVLERFCPIDFGEAPGECNVAGSVAALANMAAWLLRSKHRLQAVRRNAQAVNLVDAALARPLVDSSIQDEIMTIGAVSGTAPASLGMQVRKSGRTTGLTTGEITVLDATVSVGYGPGQTARFEGQIVTTPMSQPGDSGSLLVAGDSLRAVGLLFAGSDQSTIHSPIQAVLDCLDVTI